MSSRNINFEIKITGNGTLEEIVEALRDTADGLAEEIAEEVKSKTIRWENPTIFTEVWYTGEDIPKKGYEETEEDIENDAFNREAGYET
jgi:hypothetical protein